MQRYTPPAQRDLPASIYTTAGWIYGTFMIPKLRNFLDYLNQPHDFFKLKEVRLPGLEAAIPFFALQRQSGIFIMPKAEDEVGESNAVAGERLSKDVSCAFNSGVVSGTLEVLAGVRVSDFLMQKLQYFSLRDCSVFIRSGSGPGIAKRNIPLIMVNARQVLGVSEPKFVA